MKWNVEKTGSRAFVEMMKQEVDIVLLVTNFWGNAFEHKCASHDKQPT
jgi:hypothetical protein